MPERNPGFIHLFLSVILPSVTVVVVVVGGMALSARNAEKRGDHKVDAVRQYLTNMKTAFENNASFSCRNDDAQWFDENVSPLNGYTMEYRDDGVIQDIKFSADHYFFTETQCVANGLLL